MSLNRIELCGYSERVLVAGHGAEVSPVSSAGARDRILDARHDFVTRHAARSVITAMKACGLGRAELASATALFKQTPCWCIEAGVVKALLAYGLCGWSGGSVPMPAREATNPLATHPRPVARPGAPQRGAGHWAAQEIDDNIRRQLTLGAADIGDAADRGLVWASYGFQRIASRWRSWVTSESRFLP